MSVDTDLLEAVTKRFLEDLCPVTLVPGKISSGRLSAVMPITSAAVGTQGPRPMPYGAAKSEKGQERKFMTNGTWIDYRKLTIILIGIGEEAMGDVLSEVKALFDLVKLTVENSLTTFCAYPLDDTVTPDETTKQGEDIWRATAVWEVGLHRNQ